MAQNQTQLLFSYGVATNLHDPQSPTRCQSGISPRQAEFQQNAKTIKTLKTAHRPYLTHPHPYTYMFIMFILRSIHYTKQSNRSTKPPHQSRRAGGRASVAPRREKTVSSTGAKCTHSILLVSPIISQHTSRVESTFPLQSTLADTLLCRRTNSAPTIICRARKTQRCAIPKSENEKEGGAGVACK